MDYDELSQQDMRDGLAYLSGYLKGAGLRLMKNADLNIVEFGREVYALGLYWSPREPKEVGP